jgi:hypothetical protein
MKPLKEEFAAAVQRMMRPVVRQLIAHGISYPAFSRLMRQMYVTVAEQEFGLPFKAQTDSRIALLTGIHRKEIAQLRRRKERPTPLPEVEDSLMTHVIGRWLAPPYADGEGNPQPLPYQVDKPQGVSFARLVRAATTDLPVRSVLDELVQTGTASLLPDGHVVLQREANVPAADAAAKLTLLGSDPAELFSTIVHNIEHPDAPRLQRKVVYDNVGSEALAELQAGARRLAETFIRRANALLAARDRDRNPQAPGGQRSRVVVGTYYFEETLATAPESMPALAAKRPAPRRIRRPR